MRNREERKEGGGEREERERKERRERERQRERKRERMAFEHNSSKYQQSLWSDICIPAHLQISAEWNDRISALAICTN